jgi:RimJ/RimL family protein N-acetyltransferase
MPLCSDRLEYEPLDVAHAEQLFPVLAPAAVWRYIGPSEAPTVTALQERFAQLSGPPAPGERWENFAVRLQSGAYCGRIEATIHVDWAEIAYLFGPAYWGQGLATEAVSWLCARLEGEHRVREIWAATQPENHASRRLLQKLGFVSAPSGVRSLGSEDPGDLLFLRKR